MSFRAQAHYGPLPNEPTSQGWISATSITVGQFVGSHRVCPLLRRRAVENSVASCWVALGRIGWVGVAGRAVPCTYIHRIDQVERERPLLLCAARFLSRRWCQKKCPAEVWRAG